MEANHQSCGWPPELEDALDRLNQAKAGFKSLESEMDKFHYEYVKGMIKGHDSKTGDFAIQLRHPKESIVKGQPPVLVVQIAENLRSALDYAIFQLSKLNEPNLVEHLPSFVIADSEKSFRRSVNSQLEYLTAEQIDLIERLQPFRGNLTLELLRNVTNTAKHRHLLKVTDLSSLEIHLDNVDKRVTQYQDCFVYPAGDGTNAIFARLAELPRLLLLEKYNAFEVLDLMISQTETTLWIFSHCFCPNCGQLPSFNIEYE